MRRVVVTGTGMVTSLGDDWDTCKANLQAGNSGIAYMQEWEDINGLNTRLGGPVPHFKVDYPRKKIRTMGRVSLLATAATERALKAANLLNSPLLHNGRVGVSYGSCIGSTSEVGAFTNIIRDRHTTGMCAGSYIKLMGHTAPVNIGVFFGIRGRVITTSSACTSGSQGLGYAYEAIKYGLQDVMIAGGAEELCPTEAAVFDTMFATSTRNDAPQENPRPFDKDRDGLVIGEGAGTFILEEYEHAKARGANILAELVGFGTNSDGTHVTQPQQATMAQAMLLALEDAKLTPDAIGYVNAHGTATDRGDVAESAATAQIFGNTIPISSLKSYMGHTLGACGAIEAWMSIHMMNDGWFAPTINLDNVDPECAELDYIVGAGRALQTNYIMSNNFAFGGINTSLIFKRL